jgi:hypothetical protein
MMNFAEYLFEDSEPETWWPLKLTAAHNQVDTDGLTDAIETAFKKTPLKFRSCKIEFPGGNVHPGNVFSGKSFGCDIQFNEPVKADAVRKVLKTVDFEKYGFLSKFRINWSA